MKRPARAPLPLVTLALAVAILGVYGIELAGDGSAICALYGFTAARPSFEAAFSSLFVHDPSTFVHVGGNLVFLAILGTVVEREIGSFKFLALFVAGGLSGAGLHFVVDPSSTVPLVGCSGSLFAVIAVAAALFGPGMLAFTAVLVAINIAHAFGAPGAESVSFACHLGGFVAGTIVVVLSRLRGVDLRLRAARAVAA